MIDSHCHLNDSRFSKDLKHVLSHAQQSGIQQLIIAGVQHAQWATQLVLADKYKKNSNAFGIHPWYCDQHNDSHLQQLESLLDRAVAVGECCLDFMPNRPNHATQITCFQNQLELAQLFNLHRPFF